MKDNNETKVYRVQFNQSLINYIGLSKIKFPDIYLILEDIFKRLKQNLVDVVIS
jgi:bifunctional DNase/RNase